LNDDTIIKVVAIVSITAIEVANILTSKIDGALLGVVVGAIAGIAGYQIGKGVGQATGQPGG